MIIDTDKAFNKTQYIFIIQNSQQPRNQKEIPQLDKRHL